MITQGVDIEINFLITENDRLDTSVEYLDSTMGVPDLGLTQDDIAAYVDIDAATAEILYNGLANYAAQYDGLTSQNAPEWSANASYSHVFDLPDGSTLTPKLNMEYRDTYWSQGGGPGANIVSPGDSVQDAYTLFNVYLNWTSSDDRFNISAYAKNIEDKAILTNYGAAEPGSDVTYVTLAPPRTLGVVFSVNL